MATSTDDGARKTDDESTDRTDGSRRGDSTTDNAKPHHPGNDDPDLRTSGDG